MKRCPTCDRTFEDTMRFCQSDGTPLVDDAPPLDPYKTMVARPGDIAGGLPGSESAIPPPRNDEVLEIPQDNDPNKTMFASEDEIRREMDARDTRDEQVIEIPPLVSTPASEPSDTPSFGGAPPSPFDTPKSGDSPFGKTTPPIPSPFGEKKTPAFEPPPSRTPAFDEPELMRDAPAVNPFDAPSGSMDQRMEAQWTPPPAPDTSWQNQQIGQNTPFQPPAAGVGGQNQTLAIVSLVTGILSIFCCGWILPGVAAIVMGFIAKKKAEENPGAFGGRGLALGGIITGAISVLLGIIVIILYIFTGALASLSNM